ncbi:MAG: hypothetical protein WCQ99_00700 [Pseudomonadota bacterium]
MPADRKNTLLNASTGKGKYRIDAEVRFMGADIIISVWGGTKPHIGTVVISVPRPSLKNPQNISATSSVFNFTGHKDEAVARMFSEKIAAACNRNTVTTAGIHLDSITKNEVRKILKNAETLSVLLLKKIAPHCC